MAEADQRMQRGGHEAVNPVKQSAKDQGALSNGFALVPVAKSTPCKLLQGRWFPSGRIPVLENNSGD